MTQIAASDWNPFLEKYPNAHLLQTAEWGELKSNFGWETVRLQNGDNGAQILFCKLPLSFTIAYVPKGPVGPDWSVLWEEIDQVCRSKKVIFLRVEPDAWDVQNLGLEAKLNGFKGDCPTVQPRRTIVIDLRQSEEQILARMKQKTRYNIHLAEKRGIEIVETNDVDAFYNLMISTGERDAFGIHSKKYYSQAFNLFIQHLECKIFLAQYEKESIAGIMVFKRGDRAWYFYGASSEKERNRMPTYLLQWEAMKWAKSQGCMEYDLWGVPDENPEELEAQFETRTDGLWKVYRFKRGFGGELKRSAGAWDKVYMTFLYKVYMIWMRSRGGLQ